MSSAHGEWQRRVDAAERSFEFSNGPRARAAIARAYEEGTDWAFLGREEADEARDALIAVYQEGEAAGWLRPRDRQRLLRLRKGRGRGVGVLGNIKSALAKVGGAMVGSSTRSTRRKRRGGRTMRYGRRRRYNSGSRRKGSKKPLSARQFRALKKAVGTRLARTITSKMGGGERFKSRRGGGRRSTGRGAKGVMGQLKAAAVKTASVMPL